MRPSVLKWSHWEIINMSTLEIEVKFFLANIETVRNQLQQAGARSQGRVLEYKICF